MYHPFLVGEKIYLRNIEKQDLGSNYFQWLNDQEVTRWLSHGFFPNSEESMLDYYLSMAKSNKSMNLAIIEKGSDHHVGNVALHELDPISGTMGTGIIIGEKDVWGKGYGTEAWRLMFAHAFRTLNVNCLLGGAVAENIGSLKACWKAGYKQDGVIRQYHYFDGKYHDMIPVSCLRKDWLETLA